jgi:hypothetical protein
MTDITIPAPAAVSPEPTTTTPAAPAVTATPDISAEPTTPQAPTPAGTTDQQPAATTESLEKQPTEAELKRKERNRERWRQMNQTREDALRRAQAAESELYRIKTAKAPDFSTFTDPQEELAARTAHKVREMSAGDHEANARNLRADADRAMHEAWEVTKEDARARMPDFDQVVNERTPIHARAAPFIVESEKGADIAYWLGKNPDAARDLFNKFESAPAQALVELGRIEARLSAPAAKTTSTAPKPATVLNGGVNPLGFDASRAGVSDMAAHLRKAGIVR